jgi:CIC family chloride channel protein
MVMDEPAPDPSSARPAKHLGERRQAQLAIAAGIGAAAGVLALLFQEAIHGAEELRGRLVEAVSASGWPVWLALPLYGLALGAAAGFLVKRFAPEAGGSGIPFVKAVLLGIRPMRWLRLILVKFAGGVLAIGGGLSLGREGPTVQMGAAVGEAMAKLLHKGRRGEAQLVAAGAGAGLSAAFNAPLAGFFFVIEELRRELSPLTTATALVSCVVANVVARIQIGDRPSFLVVEYSPPPLQALPVAVLVGLAAGLVGALWNAGLLRSLDAWARIDRVPAWLRPGLAGVLAGIVVAFLPLAAGGGHEAAEAVIQGRFNAWSAMGPVLALLAVKMLLTWVSYGSGAPGGIFAPMLVVGSITGLVSGKLGLFLTGLPGSPPSAFAVIGMGAVFAASIRAPITGMVLILEMTRNYDLLLFLMIACFLGSTTADWLRSMPIYEALLARDLKRQGVDAVTHDEPLLEVFVVEPGSRFDGALVRQADLPEGALLVAVRRHGQEHVPQGDTRIEAGDEVTVVLSASARSELPRLAQGFRAEG